jgi:peroxiredoxin (alkyl hydroperoxide reductase subunit C)
LAAVASHHEDITAMNADVIAISNDSVFSHKVFHDTSPSVGTVQFPLLSDQTGAVSQSYGAWSQTGTSQRATFIVDPQGLIRFYSIYPMEVGRNINEVLRVLQGLQHSETTDEGIPAGWHPGEPGIKEDLSMAGQI